MRSKLIIFLSVFSLLGVFGVQQSNAQKVYYYVLDTVLNDYSSDTKDRPCVSNVVKINCDASESRIKNQFYDFFKAYHKRRSGDWNIDITSVTAWKFDSAQKAEMKRRELIGAYEEKDYYGKIYLVTDFNYLCD